MAESSRAEEGAELRVGRGWETRRIEAGAVFVPKREAKHLRQRYESSTMVP